MTFHTFTVISCLLLLYRNKEDFSVLLNVGRKKLKLLFCWLIPREISWSMNRNHCCTRGWTASSRYFMLFLMLFLSCKLYYLPQTATPEPVNTTLLTAPLVLAHASSTFLVPSTAGPMTSISSFGLDAGKGEATWITKVQSFTALRGPTGNNKGYDNSKNRKVFARYWVIFVQNKSKYKYVATKALKCFENGAFKCST